MSSAGSLPAEVDLTRRVVSLHHPPPADNHLACYFSLPFWPSEESRSPPREVIARGSMATVLLGAAAPISGPQEVVVRQSASYTRRAVVCFVPAVAFVLGVTQPAAAQDWVPYGTLAPSAHTVSPEVREMPDAAGRVGATVQVPLLHRPS